MRLIIAGTRDFADQEYFDEVLAAFTDVSEVVSGGATGADRMGEVWAEKNGIPCKVFRAAWTEQGKAAGPIRNRAMAEYADAAVVFMRHGGSPGSLSMISEIRRLDKPFLVFHFPRDNS